MGLHRPALEFPVACALISACWFAGALSARASAGPSFEERVLAQRAIDGVYWRHRIWPSENRGPKPELAAVISEEATRAKVLRYLRESNALARLWKRPVTGRQLQAELDRLSRQTRDSQMLRELYAALGNDAHLIAETLGRQILVERLIRGEYAHDRRFHAAVERRAREALAGVHSASAMTSLAGEYTATRYALRARGDSPGERDPKPAQDDVELAAEEWAEWSARVAGWFGVANLAAVPLGQPSVLIETSDGFFTAALLSRGEGRASVATVTWSKRSFEAWWTEASIGLKATIEVEPGPAVLPLPAAGTCTNETWTALFEQPTARFRHTAVWTGAEMIIWGGMREDGGLSVDTGGRYDPATDTWTRTSIGPGPRNGHTAVWTGTEMIVWGGSLGYYPDAVYDDGGRYDPSTDTWTLLFADANTPTARTDHTAVWTGSKMILWGGLAGSFTSDLDSGGLYDPSNNTWAPTSTGANVPLGRSLHTAVWTGTNMVVWGGQASDSLNTGGRYDPSTDTWMPTSTGTNVPTARSEHTAVWTGVYMIIWGGTGGSDGGRYDPSTDAWTPISTGANAPNTSNGHTALWTGTEMIVWGGGYFASGYLGTGGRYDPLTDKWTATQESTSIATRRFHHTAVWTGTEMIVWGGRFSTPLNTGARYRPSTNDWTATGPVNVPPTGGSGQDLIWTGAEVIVWSGGFSGNNWRYDPSTTTWTPMSIDVNVPVGDGSRAVWTGTEMIVWGGSHNGSYVNTGGRYSPLTDTWVPTSTGLDVLTGRADHKAFWTGTEMIVWGGFNPFTLTFTLNTGGRYDPLTDTWTATSTGANVPTVRQDYTAVWTGAEMIVWGGAYGADEFNTGGRYNPSTDTWTPTSTGPEVPIARYGHSAIWTGTEMIIWGGSAYLQGGAYNFNSGGRYNPATDTWTATSTGSNVPSSRSGHSAVWSGKEMMVWGGSVPLSNYSNYIVYDTGSRYNPSIDAWIPISHIRSLPWPHSGHTALWIGTGMIIWSGSDSALYSFAAPDFDDDGLGDACETGVILADADHSSRVDGFDLAQLARSFGVCDGAAKYDRNVDFDRNGCVDGEDLAILAGVFGQSALNG